MPSPAQEGSNAALTDVQELIKTSLIMIGATCSIFKRGSCFQKTDRCIVFFGETWGLTKNLKCASFSASCLVAATAHCVRKFPGRSLQKSTKTRIRRLLVQ